MVSSDWKKGNLTIRYENPVLIPFDDENINDINDAMYFYYDVKILSGEKEIKNINCRDFSKVDELVYCIDEIMGLDISKLVLKEDSELKITYSQIKIDDVFDTEYFYKLERYGFSKTKLEDDEIKEWNEYELTIGDFEINSIKENSGNCVLIKHITEEEILLLKKTAKDFCDKAIKNYNKGLIK